MYLFGVKNIQVKMNSYTVNGQVFYWPEYQITGKSKAEDTLMQLVITS